MSEQYPEVSGDESGIVPSQNMRSPEWPKKLRTLTASELDRLTIDGSGRFYWDGKLVSYDPPQQTKAEEQAAPLSAEQSAMDIIDRAVHELTEHAEARSIEGAPLPRAHLTTTDLDLDLALASAPAAMPALPLDGVPAHSFVPSDRIRLMLSPLQSLAAGVALIALLIGAAGVATYSYVAMRDWNCRIDSKQSGCPIASVAAPIARPQIPE
jgi:hypothetical protein